MQPSTRLTAALAAGGIATFSALYTTQALLPGLVADWRVSEPAAALTVSVTTGALAVSVLPWAAVADRIGRARAMRISAAVTAVVGLLLPFAPSFAALLVLRGVAGAALGALPALAIAHVVELDRTGRAAAVGGIYVAGTTVGGLTGRIVSGTVGGAFGWRWGVAATGVVVAVAAAVFVALLPGSDRPPAGPAPGRIRIAWRSDRVVWVFYLQAFLLMGGFVTVYNLLAFRLVRSPYLLSPTVVSLLFLTYLVGTVGSSAVGRLVARWGRRTVLVTAGFGMSAGALVTLAAPLWSILAGLVIVTFGFFVAHAVAVSWAGERVPQARSQASALYSLSYYLGSSVIGYLGAAVFVRSGWSGAAILVAGLAALAATIAAVGAPRTPAAP
jgi:YNFM family putative membrane transporter